MSQLLVRNIFFLLAGATNDFLKHRKVDQSVCEKHILYQWNSLQRSSQWKEFSRWGSAELVFEKFHTDATHPSNIAVIFLNDVITYFACICENVDNRKIFVKNLLFSVSVQGVRSEESASNLSTPGVCVCVCQNVTSSTTGDFVERDSDPRYVTDAMT